MGFPVNPVLYDGVLLKEEKVVKFLGVFIDEHLTWKPHITYICKKISKSIGIMFRSRFLLSETTKKSLYYTLIYSYLTYCATVWSSTYVTHVNRIFVLQKRAVRIIRNPDFHAHSEPLFFHLKILAIYNINSFYAAQFVFSYYHQFTQALFWIFLLLVAIFIIIILEFLRIFVLMPAEPIPNNLLYCFKVQKFGILYQTQLL